MRIIIAHILLPAVISICPAQDNRARAVKKEPPDLSGTWTFPKNRVVGESKITDLVLTIVQSGAEVKMIWTRIRNGQTEVEEDIYYTDGRDADKKRSDAAVVTKWRGKKLVKRDERYLPGHEMMVIKYVEWELSKDGQTLTRRVWVIGDRYPSESTYIRTN